MAVWGAKLRSQFFELLEEHEASIGGMAIARGTAEDRLFVSPKLIERIRAQPDAMVLERALPFCFTSRDSTRRFNGDWPSYVARYRGKDNSNDLLHQKSCGLATYVAINFDAAELATTVVEVEVSDEQRCMMQVEEAAVRYTILDEMATRGLYDQSDLFLDFLSGELAFYLALLGS
jgi:hypothetical protein